MYAPLPAAITGAGAGAAAVWSLYAPTYINLKKPTFRCILNMDRTMKRLMKQQIWTCLFE